MANRTSRHLQHLPASVYGFEFRDATQSDVWTARKILLQEAMNPLSISKDNNFVVAFDADKNDESVVGFGQIRHLDSEYAELASLFVRPEFRQQGIGGKLVEMLLARHYADGNSIQKVCLLTLKPTIPFYERHGFQQVTTTERRLLPLSVQLEFVAGRAISSCLGNEIVCMMQKNGPSGRS